MDSDETQSLLIEGFGLARDLPLACANPLNQTAKVGTIGLPVSSTEVKIIAEDGSELRVGGIGELCIEFHKS